MATSSPQSYLGNPFFWFAWRRLERQQNRGRPLPLIPGFENCRIFILQKSSSEENCQIWCNEWLVSGPMGAHGRHGGGRVEATCGLANCLPDHSGGALEPHSGEHHHGLDTKLRHPPHHPRCPRCHLGNSIFLIIDILRRSSINSFDRPLSPPSETNLLVVYIHVEKD